MSSEHIEGGDMNTKVRQLALLLFFSLMVLSCLAPVIASAEIRFAILPRLGIVDLFTMFKPLEEYLTAEAGEKVSILVPKDFAAFKEAVKAGEATLGFANPVIYVELRKDLDIEPLALAEERKGGAKFRGIIIAKKDSGINKIQDLKGKKLVFVDKDSAAGYIFQVMLLSKAGMDIKKDVTLLPFAKKHDNVTIAVSNGTADAGGIREDDFEKMKYKVNLSELKIVAYTDYFPNWPVFAGPKLQKDTAKKIKAALLKLRENTPEAEKVLGGAQLKGFTTVHDKDYDELRKAAKLAGAL
jgi:phosphonate transport system substrate-binding protein